MDDEIKSGDWVRRRDGSGPLMRVLGFEKGKGTGKVGVICEWIDENGKPCSVGLPADQITAAEPG